jgi:hypothetical protein
MFLKIPPKDEFAQTTFPIEQNYITKFEQEMLKIDNKTTRK